VRRLVPWAGKQQEGQRRDLPFRAPSLLFGEVSRFDGSGQCEIGESLGPLNESSPMKDSAPPRLLHEVQMAVATHGFSEGSPGNLRRSPKDLRALEVLGCRPELLQSVGVALGVGKMLLGPRTVAGIQDR
jgi:hypothetical protein